MTGTASEIFDFNNETLCKSTVRNSSSIVQLTARIFGKVNADCILNDISACGCSILLPKDQETPTDIFKLLIMSPDSDEKVHSVLSSQARWQDDDYTKTHKKMGIKFLVVTDDQRGEISVLEDLFCDPDRPLIKCSFLKP